ncbi:MAG: hypothetical protein JW969_02700, partial [Spirochaetales bacterium]|nr:hypothetical protein [Spirochaetales bacterium]
MTLTELVNIIEKEKEKILKASDFINLFYRQIFDSIVNIRDNLIPNAFSGDSKWKSRIQPNINKFKFMNYTLQSMEGKIQNNSDFIIIVLNNIQAIENLYLRNSQRIRFNDIYEIRRVNNNIIEFINTIFAKDFTLFLPEQKLYLANAIREI